jgi:hypothetical protein
VGIGQFLSSLVHQTLPVTLRPLVWNLISDQLPRQN